MALSYLLFLSPASLCFAAVCCFVKLLWVAFSVCSPSVPLDLPKDISLPCFYSALSGSLVFFWHPLSYEVSTLAWFSGIEVLTPTEWLSLHYGSVVDSLLLMVFVLCVTWEAPLRKWHTAFWWQSRPLPLPHCQGKRPHLIKTKILPAVRVPLCHVVTACICLSSSRKVSVRQDIFLILSFFFPRILLTCVAGNRRFQKEQQLAL